MKKKPNVCIGWKTVFIAAQYIMFENKGRQLLKYANIKKIDDPDFEPSTGY